ncbi:methyltransferase type 11 [Candidatus Vecturithrix granuli]|uniref:Methyltransferase type 11 n=1 Tax=Vecturithrix granuli TaxID=1499967 RepID=A0A081C569_VECG1|nr:methyltransferase type 11 [Candidatus Vecturithrix granuli]
MSYEQEFHEMLRFLSLQDTQEMTLLDVGCGTGATLLYASKTFKKIYAVDISEPMLEQAQQAIGKEHGNICFVRSGFLSYHHRGEPVDVVITKAALHHLPDFWKQIALFNMNSMLKIGGILYIFDVVFHFHPSEYREKIRTWIQEFERKAGKQFTQEVETHIRDEYSTFTWILEGMLHKAEFDIKQMRTHDGFLTEYHCIKTGDLER